MYRVGNLHIDILHERTNKMHIGMISDIHIDINKAYDIFSILRQILDEEKIDVLLIAGDISENSDQTIEFMQSLNKNTVAKCYFVPGNHDMWDIGGKYEKGDTNKVYQKYMESPYCLCGKKVALDKNWSVVGNIGWYDYSFGSPRYCLSDFEKMSLNGRTWGDHLNTKWGVSNQSLQIRMYNELEERLTEAKDKNVILVTHMLTHEYFKVQKVGEWEYFNAFLGSKSYKELCEKYHVAFSLMGHVHYRKSMEENKVKYICSCLGYENEWKSMDIYKEVKTSMYMIEV